MRDLPELMSLKISEDNSPRASHRNTAIGSQWEITKHTACANVAGFARPIHRLYSVFRDFRVVAIFRN